MTWEPTATLEHEQTKTDRVKYKAWDIEGHCWIPPEVIAVTGEGEIFTWDENEEKWLDEIIPIEVIRATGVHSKEGQEVYEGYIVQGKRYPGRSADIVKGVVQMVEGSWSIDSRAAVLLGGMDQIEILGNKFEQPHLLPPASPEVPQP